MKLIIDIEPRYCRDMHSEVKPLYYEAITRIKEAIRNGQPYEESPQGAWEDYSVDFYKCPECGYLLNKDCPSCQTKVILPEGDTE